MKDLEKNNNAIKIKVIAWNKARTSTRHNQDLYRITSNNTLVHYLRYNQNTKFGWTIKDGKVVEFEEVSSKVYDKAIEDYTIAIEVNSKDAEAYYNRGLAYANLNDYKRAIEDYDKALELNPNYTEACNNRDVAYHNLEEHDKSVSSL